MGGYHEAYAITRVGSVAVVKVDDQFCVYSTMQAAAQALGGLVKSNPGVELTIRPFHMRLPWTKRGF